MASPQDQQSTVARVAAQAQSAFDEWWGASPDARSRILKGIADALDADREGLAEMADLETHLGTVRLTGEVARTSFQLRMFANALTSGAILATEIDPEVAGPPPQGHPTLERHYVPIGVVAVFGASNFPFAFGVLGGDTAAALAAGCAVVVKEHPAHPLLCRALVSLARDAITKAGGPADLITSVQGLQEGVELVEAEEVMAIGFTGSEVGGRALFQIATSRPKPIPFYGELGSLNPVVVTPASGQTRADELAQQFVESMTLGAGQFCTKPAILIAPRNSGIVEKAQAILKNVEPMTLLTPEISARYEQARERLGNLPGVQITVGPNAGEGQVSPTLMVAEIAAFLDPDSPLREECFGPSAVILPYDEPHQALAALTVDDGVLVGCVHGEEDDDDVAPQFLAALEKRAGRVVWNGWPTGVSVSDAQMHGGPYPASTASIHTSVGLHAVYRFARPVVRQGWL